jgi:O-antigen/teichoic acid export membrane protein
LPLLLSVYIAAIIATFVLHKAMRKKFAYNLFFLLASNLLIKPVWIFGVDRVVQNKLGPEVYGTYFAVLNYTLLFSFILDFGLNNFTNRALSRNRNRIESYFSNLLSIKLVLSLAYFVLTITLAFSSGIGRPQIAMLLLLLLNQVLLTVLLFIRANIQALHLFKTDSLLSINDKLCAILLCGGLLLISGTVSIYWFIMAQSIGLAVSVAIGAYFVCRSSPAIRFTPWNTRFTRKVLLSSLPYAVLVMLMTAYTRIDSILLKLLLGAEANYEIGVYAAGYRLLDAASQFGFLFATLLLPLFASAIKERTNINNLLGFSNKLMLVFSVLVCIACSTYAGDIMMLLYHNNDGHWINSFTYTILCFIPVSSIYIFGTLLTANGSLWKLSAIALVSLASNVLLNLVLIPQYKAEGAAMAALGTQTIAALLHIWVAIRLFHLKISLVQVLKQVAALILMLLIFYLLKSTDIHWVAGAVLSSSLCLLIAGALDILPLKEGFSLLKSRITAGKV